MRRHEPTMPSRRHNAIGRALGLGRRRARRLRAGARTAPAAASSAASSASTSASRAGPAPPGARGPRRRGRPPRARGRRPPASAAGTRARRSDTSVRRPACGPGAPSGVIRRSSRRRPASRCRAPNSRLRRQKRTPTPASAPAPSTMGMIQIERDAPGVRRHQQDGLAVLGHERLVDVGVRPPGRHHALDLVPHGDGRGGVRLGHREVGARRAAHAGLEGGGALARRRRRGVDAPLPITSATTRTTTGRPTRAQSGIRARRSATGHRGLVRPGRLQERVEVLLRRRAHQDGA